MSEEFRSLEVVSAWKNATGPGPQRGVVGRSGTETVFDLHRWAPSDDAADFIEHFWSASWDLRDRGPSEHSVITFPAVHITREWGTDRHVMVIRCHPH
jgi:hypothetical protein